MPPEQPAASFVSFHVLFTREGHRDHAAVVFGTTHKWGNEAMHADFDLTLQTGCHLPCNRDAEACATPGIWLTRKNQGKKRRMTELLLPASLCKRVREEGIWERKKKRKKHHHLTNPKAPCASKSEKQASIDSSRCSSHLNSQV